MLTMIHSNRATIEDGLFKVDRKFHVGMRQFVAGIHSPVLTIHPERLPGELTMDLIEVPCKELGYDVMTLRTDRKLRPTAPDRQRLSDAIARSKLICGGDMGGADLAFRLGVPCILVREYDLQTQIVTTTSQVTNLARRGIRVIKSTLNYLCDMRNMRRAHAIHCNGYPIYEATRRLNSNRLLYLDSRMPSENVISEEQLLRRLAIRAGRPLRLLYSGRYEPMKGSDHAVRVGLACLARGLDVEMHCYGQGRLHEEMKRLAAQERLPGRIVVHPAVPFPELVEISRTFDMFVCCHMQGDPSCTYLESFGAGLPIVGYGNRMWRALSEASAAGRWSPMREPEAVADTIQAIASDSGLLDAMSVRAREFALAHAFELEFKLRIDAINAALGTPSVNADAARESH